MSKQKPPLFDLFTKLQEEAGLPLTIDQYHLLLQALAGGFGIANREELKQICRLLWVKSASSREVEKFEQYFEQYFEQLETPSQKGELNRTFIDTSSQEVENSSNEATSQNEPSSTPLPPLSGSPQSFLQTPSAVRRRALLPGISFQKGSYQLTARDFPVTERQIQNSWRYLRLSIREGTVAEIEEEATVEKICEDGFFLEPVVIRDRINRAELLLLIDVSNSMIPFHLLSQRLVDNLEGGQLGKGVTYYFRNCPQDYLYLHPQRPDAKLIQELLPKLHHNRTVALIISDGGAARGGMNRERLELTDAFLKDLAPCVRHITWLNPTPKERWLGTTAQEISQLVQMFELDSFGLKAAIRSRKG